MAVQGDAAAVRSVLVLKPSSLGDVVHTLPAVAQLKAARPEWRIAWLINTEWAPLLEGNRDVDEIILFPRQDFRGIANWPKLWRWWRARIAAGRPDLALDVQGLLRTALIGRSSRPGAMHGLADAREGARWFYRRAVANPPGVPHAIERYLALARDVLRAEGIDEPTGPLRFPLPPGTPPVGAAELEGAPFLLLHPFSRGAGKSLTDEQVREFCARLAPWKVVLVGRTGGRSAAPAFDALNFLDRTSLPELLWITRRAAGVVSVDSGPMHVAAALGRPLVSLHTWSDPRRVGPYRADAWVWKNGRLCQVQDFPNADPKWFTEPPSGLGQKGIEAICTRIRQVALTS